MTAVKISAIGKVHQTIFVTLLEKVNRYRDYINKDKIVNQNDVKYIAINTSNISQYGSLMDVSEPLLLTVCREINFFESNKEIDGLIYSHKSIFEYSKNIEIIIINKDYSLNKADCTLV